MTTAQSLPSNIGPYQVVSLLGVGGMGAVYKAFKPPLRRNVAIKTIKAEFISTPGALERFRREAELASQLKHSNIVTVFDYEELPTGDAYLVTELVEGGETLRDRMRKGKLSYKEIASIIRQVAAALDYAYEKASIVHRDIKPGNIFLEADRVALGDFGIAKDVSQDATALTLTNSALGTPNYMSPEQATGEQTLDRRADVYSLGIVLYELLAGVLPFQGDTPVSVIMGHIQKPVPPLTDYNAAILPAIQTTVEKALAKNREHRYSTAGELAQAFEEATHSPVGTTKPSSVAVEAGLISSSETMDTEYLPSNTQFLAVLKQVGELENERRYQEAFLLLEKAREQQPQNTEVSQRHAAYRQRGFGNAPFVYPTSSYKPTNYTQAINVNKLAIPKKRVPEWVYLAVPALLVIFVITACTLLAVFGSIVGAPKRFSDIGLAISPFDPQRSARELADAMQSGDTDRAEELANKALSVDVKFKPAHSVLAKILYNKNNFSEAIPHYENALQGEPTPDVKVNRHIYLTELANCYAQTNQYGKAALYYEQALAVQKDYPAAKKGLEDTRKKIGS